MSALHLKNIRDNRASMKKARKLSRTAHTAWINEDKRQGRPVRKDWYGDRRRRAIDEGTIVLLALLAGITLGLSIF